MIISCIPHCSYLPPAVTISVFQNVRTAISRDSISTISPCNTGQCEGGEAILSLSCLTHQTGGLCCPQSSPWHLSLAWAAWRRWSPASQSRVWGAQWSPDHCHHPSHLWPATPEDRVINIHVWHHVVSLTCSPPDRNDVQPWSALPLFSLGISLTKPSSLYLDTVVRAYLPPVITTWSPREILQAAL